MLQLAYISTAASTVTTSDVANILARSRHNNARDAITGLLFFDGKRFLQAIEGPGELVEAAFARIVGDQRHRAIVKLSLREIETRDFGAWAMASRELSDNDSAATLQRVASLVANAAPNIRAQFESFARLRAA